MVEVLRLTWECLGVALGLLEEATADREVGASLLRLLPLLPDYR